MKFHRTYHPKSWSQQARNMADDQIWNVEHGYETKEEAKKFFHTSYRHSLIRQRAAKRFGRKMRRG